MLEIPPDGLSDGTRSPTEAFDTSETFSCPTLGLRGIHEPLEDESAAKNLEINTSPSRDHQQKQIPTRRCKTIPSTIVTAHEDQVREKPSLCLLHELCVGTSFQAKGDTLAP
jgi:hypothetical protein